MDSLKNYCLKICILKKNTYLYIRLNNLIKKITMFNCFQVDLSPFSKKSEIEEFLISCNLQEKLDYERLWSIRNGRYTGGVWTVRIWIDSSTYNIIAYSTQNSQNFTPEYVDFLLNSKPIQIGDVVSQITYVEEELNVDNILDKIRTKGINSLTTREKDYLDSI